MRKHKLTLSRWIMIVVAFFVFQEIGTTLQSIKFVNDEKTLNQQDE